MKMKTLIMAIVALFFLTVPHAAYSQKTGEAQTVLVDANKHLILKFTNPDANKQRCAFLVGNRLTNDREEAFVIRVAHLHHRFRLFASRRSVLRVGGPEVDGISLPEHGWLYITRSRIIFVVKEGDQSHAFDLPRTDLKDKPVTTLNGDVPSGIQINLKERLVASNSREQKFVFLMTGDSNCQEFLEPDPFTRFLKRTISDFNGALAEFKQLTASLKQSGKISESQFALLPPGNPKDAAGTAGESQTTEETFSALNLTLSSTGSSIPDDEPGRKGMHHAMLSVRAANEGKIEEAKANAEIALQLLKNPGNDSEFYARGMVQHTLANYDLAIADFDKALELDPKQSVFYVSRGNAFSEKKNFDRALADFDKAIQLEPNLMEAYFERGRLYSSARDWDRAIADFDKAIQIDPQWSGTYLLRGNAHLTKENPDLAIADFDKALQLSPRDANAYNLRGIAYATKGNSARAIDDFSKAIEIDPGSDTGYYNRGKAYFESGDPDKALPDFDKAIQLTPQRAVTYNVRGSVYISKGDVDRAIADLDKAIQLDPQMTSAYIDRGIAYGNKREFDRAIADFDKAIQLDPQGRGVYYNRGLLYLKKGDYDRAIADYDKEIQLNPQEASAYLNRGAAYGNKGDIKRAIADYSKAIELKPDLIMAYQNRARAYEQLGDKVKAKADDQKVVELEKQKVTP